MVTRAHGPGLSSVLRFPHALVSRQIYTAYTTSHRLFRGAHNVIDSLRENAQAEMMFELLVSEHRHTNSTMKAEQDVSW